MLNPQFEAQWKQLVRCITATIKNKYMVTLINDLLNMVQHMMMGIAKITSHPEDGGKLWIIQGPTEEFILAVRYKDAGLFDAKVSVNGGSLVKVEPGHDARTECQSRTAAPVCQSQSDPIGVPRVTYFDSRMHSSANPRTNNSKVTDSRTQHEANRHPSSSNEPQSVLSDILNNRLSSNYNRLRSPTTEFQNMFRSNSPKHILPHTSTDLPPLPKDPLQETFLNTADRIFVIDQEHRQNNCSSNAANADVGVTNNVGSGGEGLPSVGHVEIKKEYVDESYSMPNQVHFPTSNAGPVRTGFESTGFHTLVSKFHNFGFKPCYVKLEQLDLSNLKRYGVNVVRHHRRVALTAKKNVRATCRCRKNLNDKTIHHRNCKLGKDFECDSCKKMFSTCHKLKSFVCSSTGEGSPLCEECRVNVDLKELNVHESRISEHLCYVCKRRYETLTELKSHKCHVTAERYLCEWCKKKFVTKHILHCHRWIHRSDKYQCLCGVRFKTSFAFKIHCFKKEAAAFGLTFRCNGDRKTAADAKRTPESTDAEIETCSSIDGTDERTIVAEEAVHQCSCGMSFSKKIFVTLHERIHERENLRQSKMMSKSNSNGIGEYYYVVGSSLSQGNRPQYASYQNQTYDRESSYEGCLPLQVEIHTDETIYRANDGIPYPHQQLEESSFEDKSFKCYYCGQVFTSSVELKLHVPIHMLCITCGKTFQNSHQLERHVLTHLRDEENPYSCFYCHKSCQSDSDLRQHFYTCSLAPRIAFKCSFCGMVFANEPGLRAHEQIHLSHNRQKTFQCSYCNEKFASELDWKDHEMKHVCVLALDGIPTAEPRLEREEVADSRPGREEVADSRPGREEVTDSDDSSKNTSRRWKKCRYCVKKYSCRQLLKLHESIHRSDNPNQCLRCDKKFPTPAALQNHESAHLRKKADKLYSCSQCSKHFLSKSGWKYHERTHAVNVRCPVVANFSCRCCDKKFVTELGLKAHEEYHESVMNRQKSPLSPLQCAHCRKKFRTFQWVEVHEKKCTYRSTQRPSAQASESTGDDDVVIVDEVSRVNDDVNDTVNNIVNVVSADLPDCDVVIGD